MNSGSLQDEAPRLERELGRKLTTVARQMRNRFDQSIDKIGVTRSQWILVAVVARYPGATQRVIAEKLEISEAAAGRLIDRLCADGYLERRPLEDDRRANSIYITAAAQPQMNALDKLARATEDQAFSGLTEEQLKQFDGMLQHVHANLSAIK